MPGKSGGLLSERVRLLSRRCPYEFPVFLGSQLQDGNIFRTFLLIFRCSCHNSGSWSRRRLCLLDVYFLATNTWKTCCGRLNVLQMRPLRSGVNWSGHTAVPFRKSSLGPLRGRRAYHRAGPILSLSGRKKKSTAHLSKAKQNKTQNKKLSLQPQKKSLAQKRPFKRGGHAGHIFFIFIFCFKWLITCLGINIGTAWSSYWCINGPYIDRQSGAVRVRVTYSFWCIYGCAVRRYISDVEDR